MYTKSSLLLATALAFAGVAFAAPVTQFHRAAFHGSSTRFCNLMGPGSFLCKIADVVAAVGGGGSAAGANRGGNFNTNDFHRDAANSRNTNVNRNATVNRSANVNANRNVNVNGGCCNGNYDSGPNWGGVAAGVAVGAVVGAAANSAAQSTTYAAPPPTYPPGYVAPPPYQA